MITRAMLVLLGLAWGGALYTVYLCIQIVIRKEDE